MKRLYLFIPILFAVLSANAFYYNGLYFYPTYDGKCELRGFDPNDTFLNRTVLNIPQTAYDTQNDRTYTVASIASKAFMGQTVIEHVTFPITLKSIGDEAFSSCVNIKIVSLYPTTEEIGTRAFFGCVSLTSLSTSAETVGSEAFRGCTALSIVYLGAPMKYIEPGAFMGCGLLTNIDIPFTVERIGDGVGYLSHEGTFENCINLRYITFSFNIDEGRPMLKRIGSNTFKNCISLEKLELPESVQNIQTDAFIRCTALKRLEMGGPSDLSVAASDFTGVPLERLILRGNVNFSSYSSLVKLSQLEYVRYEQYATVVPNNLFRNITSLKEVYLTNIEKIENSAFAGCTGLDKLTLSDRLTEIGISAFEDCTALTEVTFPDALTDVDNTAFRRCSSLARVNFGKNVNYIGYDVFADCVSLPEIEFPMSITRILPCLNNCSSLKLLTIGGMQDLRITNPIAQNSPIETLRLRGNVDTQFPKTLKTVLTSDYCNTIFDYTFRNCTQLQSIDLSSVETIGGWAMTGCTALMSLDLNTVKKIGSYAFDGCTSLTEVKFGSDITEIPQCLSNTGIKSIYIPDNVSVFNSPANCSQLSEVHIGDGVEFIEGFYNCPELTRLYIGSGVKSIRLEVKSLREIYISNPIPPVGSIYFWTSIYDNAELIVPVGSLNAYSTTSPWSNFFKIREFDFNGIDDVLVDKETNEDIDYDNSYIVYDMKGMSVGDDVNKLRVGNYIVKQGRLTKKIAVE